MIKLQKQFSSTLVCAIEIVCAILHKSVISFSLTHSLWSSIQNLSIATFNYCGCTQRVVMVFLDYCICYCNSSKCGKSFVLLVYNDIYQSELVNSRNFPLSAFISGFYQTIFENAMVTNSFWSFYDHACPKEIDEIRIWFWKCVVSVLHLLYRYLLHSIKIQLLLFI